MNKIILPCIALLLSCGCLQEKPEFVPTKYADDTKLFTLRQCVGSPINGEFIGVFYETRGVGSGRKILKLYSSDSISIDQKYYGEHPMSISEWSDSSIVLGACVYDAHGDSTYRKWYLDNSVDKNTRIGRYTLTYVKSYDCDQRKDSAVFINILGKPKQSNNAIYKE